MLEEDSAYRDVQLRYQNTENRVEVFSAMDIARGKEVIVKRITCDSQEDAEFYMLEGQNVITERHPNICECYDVYCQPAPRGHWWTLIVTERLVHDLHEELEERKTTLSYISESRVWTMLQELVSALAYLQRKVRNRQELAHRDLKPHNIFVDASGKAKIGDFGSSKDYKSPSGLGQHTVLGTPLYLSPKIRIAYSQFFTDPSIKVVHNVYKSDVFSLGLTFVHVLTLNPPTELAVIVGLEGKIREYVGKIERYSTHLREILLKMLIVEEDARPDFVELERDFPGEDPPPILLRNDSSDFPIIASMNCLFCSHLREVFLLCHPICLYCYRVTAKMQLQEGLLPLSCPRCHNEYPRQLFSLLDD